MVAGGEGGAQAEGPSRWLCDVAVAAVIVAFYSPVLGFSLVFDDLSLIAEQGPVPLGGDWLPYRPLRYLSLWFDHIIGGGRVWVYHLDNLFLHAAVSVLVARIARRLGAGAAAAAMAALFFAVHPLTVEVVAYVSGRRDLLATFFGMAALAAWINPRGLSVWATAFFIAAVAAKESALAFAAVLALASASGLGPRPGKAWPVLAPALAAAVTLVVAYGARGPLATVLSYQGLSTAGRMACHYGLSIIWPAGLSADYPALHLATASPASALAAVALAAAAAFSVWLASKRRAAFFALAWLALVALVTVSVVAMHEPGADRHAYPALAALAVFLALLASSPRRLASSSGPFVLAALALLLSSVGWQRLPVWKDQGTLWAATASQSPASARAHLNLASLLSAGGAVAHARAHLRSALATDRAYLPAHLGLAALACSQGQKGRARLRLKRARRLGGSSEHLAAVMRLCSQASAKVQGQ